MFDQYWNRQIKLFAPLLEATDTRFVFDSLTDDTVTVFRGTGFTYANGIVTGGTITSMEWTHRDGNGDRLLQSAAQITSYGNSGASIGSWQSTGTELRSLIGWTTVIDPALAVKLESNTGSITYANTDGTYTVLSSLSPISQTYSLIYSIRHVDTDGQTVLAEYDPADTVPIGTWESIVRSLFPAQAATDFFRLGTFSYAQVVTNHIGDGDPLGPPPTILGASSSARYVGGSGFDVLDYSSAGGVSSYMGSPPNWTSIEEVRASVGNDRIYANSESTTIFAGAGDDIVNGGDGIDQIYGGDGFDTADYYDSPGSIVVRYLVDSTGQPYQVVTGSNIGTDILHSIESISDPIMNDVLIGSRLAETISVGLGEDTVRGMGGDDTIKGLRNSKFFDGGAGDDSLFGGWNDDRLYGGPGDDEISGGRGHDQAKGGDGNDTISGGAGSDHLYGDAGDDILDGGASYDWLDAGTGRDVLRGGGGNDIYTLRSPGQTVIEDPNRGNDWVYGYASVTLATNVEALFLKGSAVKGIGNDLKNYIEGNAIANVLSGLGGNDIINAGSGNDRLIGGAGNDYLTGGNGFDTVDLSNRKSGDFSWSSIGSDQWRIVDRTGVLGTDTAYLCEQIKFSDMTVGL